MELSWSSIRLSTIREILGRVPCPIIPVAYVRQASSPCPCPGPCHDTPYPIPVNDGSGIVQLKLGSRHRRLPCLALVHLTVSQKSVDPVALLVELSC